MEYEPTMLGGISHLKKEDLEFNIEEIVARMRLVRGGQREEKFAGDPLGFQTRVEIRAPTPPTR